MKYLINTTDVFRCDNESEAEAFLNTMKKDSSFEIVSSTISKKETKSKGEVVDSWVRLTIKKVFNNEKEPEVAYYAPEVKGNEAEAYD